MNAMNSTVPTQMITPINSLPLKTSSQQETEIDDPLIQNVLKEFEDELAESSRNQPQQMQPPSQFTQPQQAIQQPPQQSQQQLQQQMQQNIQTQQPHYQDLQYNTGNSKKLFNMEIAKKALFMTFVLFALQYMNVLKIITNRLPESFSAYISGREIILDVLFTFIVIYTVLYLELV